jgi:hypothetical protein
MSKCSRILLIVAAVIIAGGLYFWLFGVQTYFAVEAGGIARKVPTVAQVSVALPETAVSSAPGKKARLLQL